MPHEDIFSNNPDELDSEQEIEAAIRGAGGDPMDSDTEDKALFGWSLLNSYEDNPPASREDPAVFAAETEMQAANLHDEHGIVVDDWPVIENAPEWYDGP
ncbi:MAG: hypothetical protein ABEH58_06130 [Haloplanus sp.]